MRPLFDKPDPVKTANVILMRLIRPSAGQTRKIHFNRESAALTNITYGRERLKPNGLHPTSRVLC